MEETSQEEKQELEIKDPKEEQGGILRRLRDRDLLRKRKAEAEEKETNQEESPRKRQRADKSGTKRRGRPRKSQPTPEISVSQEEAVDFQEVPAAVPEPAEVIPDQSSGSVESQPAPVLAAPALLPVFGSLQSPVFAPTLTSPAAVNPTPTLTTPPLFASSSAGVLDTSPAPVEELVPSKDPVTDPVSVQDPAAYETPVVAAAPTPPAASSPPAVNAPFAISTAPPAAPAPPATPAVPLQEETLTSTQGREALNQVLIEDLGPDVEEDITRPEDKRDDADLSETPSFSASEQNIMFSVPTLTSQPPPQGYLPGNSI